MKLLTRQEAAQLVGCHVDDLGIRHLIPFIRIGPRTTRFDEGEVLRYIRDPHPALVAAHGISLPGPGVYFVACGRFVKIGWSQNIAARLSQLAGANPQQLCLLAVLHNGGAEEEKYYHRIFARCRAQFEWFYFKGSLKRMLDRLRSDSAVTRMSVAS